MSDPRNSERTGQEGHRPTGGPHGRRRGSGRLLAPIAIAVVVILVLGGVAAGFTVLGHRPGNQSAGGSSNSPGSTGQGSGGTQPTAPAGGVLHVDSVVLAGRVYGPLRLVGSLPASGPDRGVTYALPGSRAPESLVRRLATALGLSGSPRHVAGAWVINGEGSLRVSDTPGWPWTYASARAISGTLPGCADLQRNHPGLRVMSCAVGPVGHAPGAGGVPVPDPVRSGGPTPGPAPVTPNPGKVKAAVNEVLAALGEQDATRSARGTASYTVVTVQRTVDGLPVAGFSTVIVTTPEGVSSATGWLAGTDSALTATNSYALIGARAGYRRAASAPQGMHPDICRIRPGASTAECVGGEPRKVTGATVGLGVAHTADGGALLVPAWLFSLAGDEEPLAVVAVAGNRLQAASGQAAPLRGSVG